MARAFHQSSTFSPRAFIATDSRTVHGPSTGRSSAGGDTPENMNTNSEAKPEHVSAALARALEVIRKAEG
jgi:hypothetical protein